MLDLCEEECEPLVWVVPSLCVPVQQTRMCRAQHLKQPARVMVGITFCVSYVAFTVSFYCGGFLTIQELGESPTITSFCSCAC